MTKAKEKQPSFLDDGILRFRVNGSGGKTVNVEIDLMIARLEIDRLEGIHAIEESGKRTPTPAFLKALAAALAEHGIDGCTPTMAYQIWIASDEAWTASQKKTS